MRATLAILVAMAATFAGSARAAALPDVRIDAVLQGGNIRNADDHGGVAAETVWIKGDKTRVDFDAGEGRRGRILRGGGHAWLLMSSSDRALPANHVKIGAITRLDPTRPCWDLGFFCESTGSRVIAGHVAQGWRYRHAGQNGPGGTDSGEFWIDEQYGLLLAYQAQDLAEKAHRMQATAVSFGKIDDDTFALPKSIRVDVQKADARADALRGYEAH